MEFKVMGIGVVVVDGDFDLYGKIIFGNRKLLKLLGCQAENILGKTVHSVMPKVVAEVHN